MTLAQSKIVTGSWDGLIKLWVRPTFVDVASFPYHRTGLSRPL